MQSNGKLSLSIGMRIVEGYLTRDLANSASFYKKSQDILIS